MAYWPILDMGIDYGASGGPTFSTAIVVSASGYETRQAYHKYPRGRWQLGERLITGKKLEYLQTIFNVVRGRWLTLRYKDWNDYKATKTFDASAPAYTYGSGAPVPPNQILLEKVYYVVNMANEEMRRQIKAPKAGTVQVEINGSPVSVTAVDEFSGLVTVDSTVSVSDDIKCDFEFYVPARFDTDEFTATFENMENDEQVYFLSSLPVVEVLI